MQSVFTDTMNQDNLFHLMIHADIDTVRNICLTQSIDYCHDAHFWKLKFGHDQLPILINPLPTTLTEWRKEYIRVETAANLAMDLLDKIKKGNAVHFNYTSEQF